MQIPPVHLQFLLTPPPSRMETKTADPESEDRARGSGAEDAQPVISKQKAVIADNAESSMCSAHGPAGPVYVANKRKDPKKKTKAIASQPFSPFAEATTEKRGHGKNPKDVETAPQKPATDEGSADSLSNPGTTVWSLPPAQRVDTNSPWPNPPSFPGWTMPQPMTRGTVARATNIPGPMMVQYQPPNYAPMPPYGQSWVYPPQAPYGAWPGYGVAQYQPQPSAAAGAVGHLTGVPPFPAHALSPGIPEPGYTFPKLAVMGREHVHSGVPAPTAMQVGAGETRDMTGSLEWRYAPSTTAPGKD
ncbi:uncharacterized protein LOC115473039 isoform X2 [Microcaecilia unicolor]|uniref:Uncharacterized protein LOC115473039 isoform X2 n=1 Tax=Microcaecilia unicolor TaxID=1415580 RepID=A0A6P7YKA3_9AMPH|nr:uncharacterized protein LOC115473039 isoform X2 [Microcaecilia unicolor]